MRKPPVIKANLQRSLLATAIALTVTGPMPLSAAVIQVNSTCTLIKAINEANTTANTESDCTDGDTTGTDTLMLLPNSTHTFNAVNNTSLGPNALPLITTAIRIEGNGATLQRSGPTPFRLFSVSGIGSYAGDLALDNITLQGGLITTSAGGAINVRSGTLSVTNSRLINNTGRDGGALNVYEGTANLSHSTVSGNTATGGGGGIYNRQGTMNIKHSTISGNSAYGGGGITNSVSSVLTLANTTVSGNSIGSSAGSAGGGMRNGGATLNVYNSTVSNNSGANHAGIFNHSNGTLTLKNSVLADNGGQDCSVATGASVTADNSNIIEVDACTTSALTGDPKLGPLQDNGGNTLSHALLTGSIAINAPTADNTVCNAVLVNQRDQTGVGRPIGSGCDIGAVEYTPPGVNFTVDASCSLANAINAANSNMAVGACPAGGGHDTITLAEGSYHTLTVPNVNDATTGLPEVTSQITIEGNGSTVTTSVSGFRLFKVAANGTLNLDRLRVSNGNLGSSNNGGGIYNLGFLSLAESTITGNTAADGAGIYNIGSLSLSNSTVDSNSASVSGGGIATFGPTEMHNSTVSDNTSGTSGGGLFISDSRVSLSNSTITYNETTNYGGGVASYNGKVRLLNVTMEENFASSGSALYNYTNNGYFSLINTIIASEQPTACHGSAILDLTNNWLQTASCGAADGPAMLGTLSPFNGGPTQTHALSAASGPVNAGNNDWCAGAPINNLDQRGEPRPDLGVLGTCDIGSVEHQLDPVTLTVDPSGPCNTLVDAISAAETNTAVGGCPAGGSHDTIVLQNASVHTISVKNNDNNGPGGLPFIQSQITIQGNGATITRDNSAADFRLFGVGYHGELNIHDTTISNGAAGVYSGGGILTYGKVSLHNSTVSGNTADAGGGIKCSSSIDSAELILNNSQIINNASHYGGGIAANRGCPVTLNNSRIANNNGGSGGSGGGGGISSIGSDLTLNSSTVSGNTADGNGGGIRHDGGDTIVANNSTLTLNNSTLSGNSADKGGAIESYASNIVLNNSTLANNMADSSGSAIYSYLGLGSVVNMNNTVIAHTDGTAADCEAVTVPVTTNWFEDASCSGAAQGDPKLGPLKDNGGSTQTHMPESSSPLIDAGDDALCAAAPINNLDQIGTTRPVGEQCDIGAVEYVDDGGFFVIPIPGGKVVIFSL